jgi:hypothetical protein
MASRKTIRVAAGVLVAILSLPLLYAISSGPAVYLWRKGILPETALNGVYDPLLRLSKLTGTERTMRRYWYWWEVRAYESGAPHIPEVRTK